MTAYIAFIVFIVLVIALIFGKGVYDDRKEKEDFCKSCTQSTERHLYGNIVRRDFRQFPLLRKASAGWTD